MDKRDFMKNKIPKNEKYIRLDYLLMFVILMMSLLTLFLGTNETLTYTIIILSICLIIFTLFFIYING